MIERRPENAFFERFANVFTYETPEQVSACAAPACAKQCLRSTWPVQRLCSACAAPVQRLCSACAAHVQRMCSAYTVLTSDMPAQFRAALRTALVSTPAPLTEKESHALSWAGGTERFLGAVTEASRLAAPPRLSDNAARCAHLWLLGSGLPGYLGDAVRTFVFESGPVSRQRWLARERRYRTSTSVTEVVDKSIALTPAQRDEHWEQRYENKTDLFGNWNLTRARLRMEQSLSDVSFNLTHARLRAEQLYENARGSLRKKIKKGKKK